MTCTTCPNCGWSLATLDPLRSGELFIDKGGAHVWWGKSVIPLTASERLILIALVRADGAPMKREVLADVVGYDGDAPAQLVAVYASRIRRRFKAVDRSFDQIETVRGSGLRWAA